MGAVDEQFSSQDFILRQTGRYAQSSAYILRLAADAGMTLLAEENVVVRKERDQPVDSTVLMLQKQPTYDQCDPP